MKTKTLEGVLWAILLALLIVSTTAVSITVILTKGSSNPVETGIISHTIHGDGYQLRDSVNNQTCLIYPDALEPGDRLDCYGSAK